MLNFIKTTIVNIILKIQGLILHYKYGIDKETLPTRTRLNDNKSLGYTISITGGGKSGEGFVRVTRGKRVSYFPNYNRNGAKRANKYVPFKQHKGKMIFQHLNSIN